MRIEGASHFAAAPADVYKVFTDPETLRSSTPGCQSMEAVGPDKWEAVLKLGVAGISGTYKGVMQLEDKRENEHYKLVIQGQGAPGHVTGWGELDFKPAPDGGTDVAYVWDVQVGGLVASVGQRVLGSVGKMLIGQFMQAMGKSLT